MVGIMALNNKQKLQALARIYLELVDICDARQEKLDRMYDNEPGCGPIGTRGGRLFDGFLDVKHGVTCVKNMQQNIKDLDARIHLKLNPPEPERIPPTDQELFDSAIGVATEFNMDISKIVGGL